MVNLAVTDNPTGSASSACNVLLVYPRFAGETFWNFAAACEIFGAKYPTSPLGLITVAAMLPTSWNLRLVDRNVEDLADSDLDWADLVMTGGMLPQHDDLLEIINLCRDRNKPVAIGGPWRDLGSAFLRQGEFPGAGRSRGRDPRLHRGLGGRARARACSRPRNSRSMCARRRSRASTC